MKACKISLGLHCRRGANPIPKWQSGKKCFVLWGMLLLRADISVQPPPPLACLRLSEKTNQGHLRTACQQLFLLAILYWVYAVKESISTTSNSWGRQGISNCILTGEFAQKWLQDLNFYVTTTIQIKKTQCLFHATLNVYKKNNLIHTIQRQRHFFRRKKTH